MEIERKREKNKRWYEKNKDIILERKKQLYLEKKDKLLQKVKTYYQKNKKTKAKAMKEYRSQNAEILKLKTEKTKQLLTTLKKVFILGSFNCGLVDTEIKSIVEGFKKFRDYDELTNYFVTLCNIDSEGFNHGIISYQITIKDYTDKMTNIITEDNLQADDFYKPLKKLCRFCEKKKINVVEIFN